MYRNKRFYVLVICMCVSLFIVCGFLLGSNYVKGLEIKPNKIYMSIKIEKNDTLWSISRENMNKEYYNTKEYIKELKHINNLSSDIILHGDHIIVPIIN
ncbi:LysM peptidoglycan-binding domain-containing protein [Vallitalea guaymasensis]|uniref:LysM peptidoglycan-binding domain-containing protein n=1 Tax=Vallitalea guaymasensis TaxID=1185412 RepID=A0A8J8MF12_9FIRM|nr:LysM peptidoglycan-binding domain-containing protein [Vallitalea guaymasensis]QUH31639.1 LysM peptidoglycan-binding domain-containing protein [Vallitalea guaymasensis]